MSQRFSRRGLTILVEGLAANQARPALEPAARVAREPERKRRVAGWITLPFGKLASALARVAPW
jgi:hypothetical protein